MNDLAPAIGAYLSGLPDEAWADLHEIAGGIFAEWPAANRREVDRGISISYAITRARLAESRSPGQARIEEARCAEGPLAAAEMIARDWATHNAWGDPAAPAPA